MTFTDLAHKVLKEINQPLNAEEIWAIAVQKGYNTLVASEGKTPWATIGARIYVNIRDKPDSIFAVTETRPKKFYLKNSLQKESAEAVANKESISIKVPQNNTISFLEKDLHPFLSYYAFYYLKCYTKTLSHTKSDKKEFGEWVHPDMIGCYYPLDEWKTEVFEFSSAIGNVSIRILSFELKREVNFSNLRESFFQAVSNSSWANESYLVAAEISKDEEFRNELKRLSTSFGIGIIKLDLVDPDSSEIVLPAKFKEYLDWDTINKLTMNPDFKEFLKRVKNDISSKEIRKEKYDKIYEKEELVKMIHRKMAAI